MCKITSINILLSQRLSAWLMLAFVLCVACKKNVSSSKFSDDKLVVLAEITAGDSVEIPIGKTFKVGGGSSIGFQKVNDATVMLRGENNRSWMLKPNYAQQFTANPTTIFSNRHILKANTEYFIEIKHPVFGTVTGSTQIPALPNVTSMDTVSDSYQGKEMMATTVTWQDDGNNESFYIIEALKELVKVTAHFYHLGARYNLETPQGKALYDQLKNSAGFLLYPDTVSLNKFLRIHLYTQDNASENYRIDNLVNPFRRIFFHIPSSTSQAYTTKVFVDKQFLVASDPSQKGRLLVQVKKTSKELFDYLLLYEKYKTDFGTVSTSQLISPVGNIQNGLGIFGGSSRKQRIFYFDKL